MATTLVRVDAADHEKLKLLAKQDKLTIQAVIGGAIRALERQKFWDEYDRQMDAVAADRKAGLLPEKGDLCYDDPRVAKYGSSTSAKRPATSKKASAPRSSSRRSA